MYLSPLQTFLMILAIALGTVLTRSLAFLLFPDSKKHPPFIDYLSRVLPPAMMGLLVVYCLKDISFLASPHGLPELLAIGTVVLLHLWRRNMLLSIASGTIVYMVLVQKIFL